MPRQRPTRPQRPRLLRRTRQRTRPPPSYLTAAIAPRRRPPPKRRPRRKRPPKPPPPNPDHGREASDLGPASHPGGPGAGFDLARVKRQRFGPLPPASKL